MENGKANIFCSGSFSQDDDRFGESRNSQCLPIAVAMCTYVNSYYNLGTDIPSEIIDQIVIAGDSHYKKIKKKFKINEEYLNLPEVLRTPIELFGSVFFPIELPIDPHGLFPRNRDEFYLRDLLLQEKLSELIKNNTGKSIVFIGCSMAVSIWSVDGRYYLFDSHGVDENGYKVKGDVAKVLEFEKLGRLSHVLIERVTEHTYNTTIDERYYVTALDVQIVHPMLYAYL